MKYIESPLLGRSRIPTKKESEAIEKLTKECPAACFQEVNKYLNSLGLVFSIQKIPELEPRPEGEKH